MRDFDRSFPMASNLQYARGVLLYDDMEGADMWESWSTGAAGTKAFDAAVAYAGTKGLKMTTRVAGAAAADVIYVYRRTGLPETNFVCWRGKFTSPSYGSVGYCQWQLTLNRGGVSMGLFLRYDRVAAQVQYRNAAGAWVEIPGMFRPCSAAAFTNFELVGDISSGQYVSVALNGHRASLRGIPGFLGAAPAVDELWFMITVATSGAAAATMWVDGVYAGEWDGM